ncbi:MAG TPA: cupin domain-containing protein [Longimicrobiales bacterium]|nr:cupin domain-containing protein [Longimicrobiales bacterium]
MRNTHLAFESHFDVVLQTADAQAAARVLQPGESTGGPDNRHEGSAQWLFVVGGEGEAVVEGESVDLAARMLLLIEAGEAHEIRCTGDEPLRTLNVYVPPEF